MTKMNVMLKILATGSAFQYETLERRLLLLLVVRLY